MKLTKSWILNPFSISGLLLLGVWGCSSNTRLTASSSATPFRSSTLREPISIIQQPDLAIDPRLVEAQTEFGFNLFSAILQEADNRNVLISPASVAITLSMVYNGADGETQQAIAETLAIQGLNVEEVNAASASLINALGTSDPNVRVNIANSLWVRQDFPLYPAFVEQVTQFFNAEASNLDFTNPSALEIINAWVAEKTAGKITQMVDQISSDDVLFLLNAVYFKGNWTKAFDPQRTTEQPFYLLNGTTKPHLQMTQDGEYPYYETDQFQAISLPYGDNRLSLYVFLPKQTSNLANFQTSLSAETWSNWMNQFRQRRGSIKLPRFQFDYEARLKSMLEALGMGIAFDRNQANFTQLSPEPTAISRIKHKAVIEVNEEGTEAAAATSIGIQQISARIEPESPFEMVVDRPFFIAIQDNATDAILFMGSVVEP